MATLALNSPRELLEWQLQSHPCTTFLGFLSHLASPQSLSLTSDSYPQEAHWISSETGCCWLGLGELTGPTREGPAVQLALRKAPKTPYLTEYACLEIHLGLKPWR